MTGTKIVNTVPLKIETNAYSFPENLLTTDSVESIEVAPPDAIGANFPNPITKIGAKRRIKTSLIIFTNNTITLKASYPHSPKRKKKELKILHNIFDNKEIKPKVLSPL